MVVMDTHTLIWFVSNPEELSEKVRKVIDKEIKKNSEILVSSISVWEIYMLIKKGRLKLTMEVDNWLDRIEKLPFLRFIPVDNRIAARSVMLPSLSHEDPADRIIIATSLQYAAPLLTRDKRILNYPKVQAVW